MTNLKKQKEYLFLNNLGQNISVRSIENIIDKIEKEIGDDGAVRIHGGGFKGTVLVFVKDNIKDKFEKYLEEHYKNRYYKVFISKHSVNYIEF